MSSGTPLFSLLRGGYEEITIHGEVVVFGRSGIIFQAGTSIGKYPARSLLKPFQFFASEIPLSHWELASGNSRYAACLGSISATETQVAKLEADYQVPILQTRRLKNRVPVSFPMDEFHRVQLKERKQTAQQIFHTCFSKHSAILEACEVHGWNLDDYLSQSHPYQKRLNETLGELLENRLATDYVVDGCGLPTPVLSLEQMAKLYWQLASQTKSSELLEIRKLMLTFPEWIGGPGRVDTKLIENNQGRVISKDGADGLLAIGVLPSFYPGGLGIVVKLSAGYYPPLAAIAVSQILEGLGLTSVHQIPKGQSVKFWLPEWRG